MFVEPQQGLVVPAKAYTEAKYTVKLREAAVEEHLRSKDRTTAKGPTGMGYGDLQDLVEEKDFVKHLTTLLNAIVSGSISRMVRPRYDCVRRD